MTKSYDEIAFFNSSNIFIAGITLLYSYSPTISRNFALALLGYASIVRIATKLNGVNISAWRWITSSCFNNNIHCNFGAPRTHNQTNLQKKI